jgi:hypothetical protein
MTYPNQLNLSAPITPGISAAGYSIGSHLSEYQELLPALVIDTAKKPFSQLLKESKDWIFFNSKGGRRYFYCDRLIYLAFNSSHIIYNIAVFSGYSGKAFDKISIGSKLSELKNILDLEYDDGDEAYYPLDSTITKGISFSTGTPFEASDFTDKQLILAISIHDWTLQD